MKVSNGLRDHWGRLLRPIFPDRKHFYVDPAASDFRAEVRWKVGTDPDRPSKMSKTLCIVVPVETARDYENKSDTRQQLDDKRLLEFVKSELANHDPDHDNPKGVLPPVVDWVAGSNVLNS